jgi:cell division protein FtsI (penicillin-binding protein 3)
MDKNFRIRLGVSFLCIAALGSGVLLRAGYLMLLPSDRLQSAMSRQFRQEPPRMPRRGYILDRNKEPIAVSMEVKSLFANPSKVKHKGEVAQALSKILKIPAAQIKPKLGSERGFIWIKRQLTQTEQESVEDLLESKPAYGLFLGLSRESKRFYPNQNLAAQVLGFTGMDSNGLEGLELFYEKELSGTTSPNGKVVTDGHTLVLTLDKALQHTVEEELTRGLKDTGGVAATGIIMDAETGDVVAMASAPTFNANKFGSSTAEHRRNRSVTDTYEPGSTMKPLLVSGALEANVIKPTQKVFCEYGKLKIGKYTIKEAEVKDKWGWLTPGQVILHSSNIGATKIGFMMGSELIFDNYKKLGISERTGVDLPGETTGTLVNPSKWSKVQESNISFGHGLAVTPLQVVRAYAAIANGGTLVTPRLVKQFLSFEGEPLKTLPEGPKKKVLEPKTASVLANMMAAVTGEGGTAPKGAIPGYVVAGKTGTSQKAIYGKGYKSGKHQGSFVGFVRGMKPSYVVYVMVDEPRFPYFGGEAAAPIFKRIMMAALAREGFSPDPVLISKEIKLGKKDDKRITDKIRATASAPLPTPPSALVAAEEGNFMMPDLEGLTARDVMDLFSGKDLQLRLKGSGLVKNQRPLAGALLKPGEVVTVNLNREAVLP